MATNLRQRLVEWIRESGPLTFADYMDAALYDPQGGFYARGQRLGPRGAFLTAPTRQPTFADAVAAEVRACRSELGLDRLVLVEAGPGDGALAASLAEKIDGLERIALIERAAGMRAVQEEALAGVDLPVEWFSAPEELEPVDGFLVANELFDALAVRLLEWPDEILVGAGEDGMLTEVHEPAPPELAEALRAEVEPREGSRYAVRPEAGAMLGRLARVLRRGRLLVADYGGEGAAVHTGRDPIRTYVGGMRGAGPLEAPGNQDLTADVDFGELRRAARELGLAELLYEPQETWRVRRAIGEGALFEPPAGALAGFHVLLLEARG
jgi:SAM-dependent MidA family methyltransferase